MMLKIRKIHLDIYGFDLFYLVSSWSQCVKLVKKYFNSDLGADRRGNGYATNLSDQNNHDGYFIWMETGSFGRSVEIGNLAHEAFHAVKFILMDYAGMNLSNDSDEAFAYLLGYICNTIIADDGEIQD